MVKHANTVNIILVIRCTHVRAYVLPMAAALTCRQGLLNDVNTRGFGDDVRNWTHMEMELSQSM